MRMRETRGFGRGARRTIAAGAMAALAAAALAWAGSAFAESPGRLVSKGNRQYGKKAFGEALELYDKASVKAPESPIVSFNKGAALYKQGDYEKAAEHFKTAASKTKSLPFEAKAWYNLGNVAFKEGERQEDSDLQKALGSLQESVKHYSTALEKDPKLEDAAQNLEIARLKIKDLLDKIKNQQQNQGQNQQNQQNQQGQQNQQNQQGQQDQQNQQQGQQQQQQGQDQQNKDQQQQQQQQQQAGQEKQDQQKKEQQQGAQDKDKQKALARDETARQILDEEKQNRKERQREEGQATYRRAEKDW